MVVSLCYLLEILAVIYSLHYLYNEEIRFDIATIELILVELFGMNALCWFKWHPGLSLLIYPMIVVYSGIRFGVNPNKIIVNNVLCVLILTAVQTTISILFSVLLEKNVLEAEDLLIVNGLLFVIVLLAQKKQKLSELAQTLRINEKLILASIVMMIVSIASFIIVCKKDRQIEIVHYLILILIFTLMIISIIDIGIHKVKMKEFQAELRLHKLYEKSFRNLIEDICARQHEFDNHINTIYSQHFLHHTYEELVNVQRKYCENIIEANHFNKLLSKGNPIILGFLYGKLTEAEKNGIDVTYKVNIEELESKVPVHKLVEILGNLLNNAIEVLVGEEKLKKMNLVMIENSNEITIKVSNECSKINYNDVQGFFKKGYSSKGKNRGYGLYNVKKICEEYNVALEAMLDEEDGNCWLHFILTINKSL